jgi:hypothetical protein
MNTPKSPPEPTPTPREQFEAMAKRIISVPKKDVDAAQAEWKKTKHKRGPKPSALTPNAA